MYLNKSMRSIVEVTNPPATNKIIPKTAFSCVILSKYHRYKVNKIAALPMVSFQLLSMAFKILIQRGNLTSDIVKN